MASLCQPFRISSAAPLSAENSFNNLWNWKTEPISFNLISEIFWLTLSIFIIFSSGDSSSKYSATLDKIVDVTIAYPDGKPLGLFDILSAWRPPCTIHVHYKIFDIEQLPRKTKELRHWMYKLYTEKEKLLEEVLG